jgi:FkbM family methyltransferase
MTETHSRQKSLDVIVLEALNHILSSDPVLSKATLELLVRRFGLEGLSLDDIKFISEILKPSFALSRSQLRQDLFVLHELDFKHGGFFVEFGATNGVDLSNTFILEKKFGWSGILAEPAKVWHAELIQNRSCHIETKCVWRSTGEQLTFSETREAELSTITEFVACDGHSEVRKDALAYSVETISLNDLLEKYNAPRHIDYLSIDTEGSEYEILSGLDFDRYDIKVITCEHNFMPSRDKIFRLLSDAGYIRKFENISAWDDWYVRQ